MDWTIKPHIDDIINGAEFGPRSVYNQLSYPPEKSCSGTRVASLRFLEIIQPENDWFMDQFEGRTNLLVSPIGIPKPI